MLLSLSIVLTSILNSAKQFPYQNFNIARGYLNKIVILLYHHITIAAGIINKTNVRFKLKLNVNIIVNTNAKPFPIAFIKMDVN